jgi:3'-phosphoadenosine 5'-phosphosulfate sulfotransferase (PAPS reductase)/FAD synthetase
MLWRVLQANNGLPAEAKVLFSNTGKEEEATLRFVRECEVRWSVPIVWLEFASRAADGFSVRDFDNASRNGEPLAALMEYFGFPPNRAARFCSHEGKTRTAKRYCVSLGWERWTVAVGIRADEAGRAVSAQPRDRYGVWYPLIDAGVGKADVAAFWRKQPFDLRLPNIKGVSALGNCDGCFLKSEAKRAMLARDYPDRAQWWADQERRFGGMFHQATSWAEMMRTVRDQGDWIFDMEDALCQADGGECVA